MTVSLVSKSARTLTGSGGGNITMTMPASTQSGDLLICVITATGAAAVTPPAGWTLWDQHVADGTNHGLMVAYIVRGAGTPDLVFTRTGGTNAAGYIIAYRTDASFTVGASSIEADPAHGTVHTNTTGVPSAAIGDMLFVASAMAAAFVVSSHDADDPGVASGSTADMVTAPTADTNIMRHNEAVSASAAFTVSFSDGLKSTAGASGNIVATTAANTKGVVFAGLISDGGGGGGDSLTVDEIAQNKVFDGASGSSSVTISGTYTGADDTIQVQLERTSDSGVEVAWTTLATGSGGAFSGSVTAPRGGWYIARCRKAGDTGVADVQSQQWGVGLIVGALGQSHLEDMTTEGTGTVGARSVIFNGTTWSALTTTGQGRNTFASELATLCDCPVAIIWTGVGGTGINYWYTTGGGKTTAYDTWEAMVTAAGGLSAFVWWQGDANAVTSMAGATYVTEASGLFAQLRSDHGATIPITIVALGRKSGGVDNDWEEIRDAHTQLGSATDNYLVTTLDLPQQGDGQHFLAAGLATAGTRIAYTIAEDMGDVAFSQGPAVSSVTKVDTTTVDVNLSHDNGTDFTPTTGISGFTCYDADNSNTPVAVTAAVRVSGTKIRLTLASAIAGPVTVRYGFGAYPDISGYVVDNTALNLPLRSTGADLSATGSQPTLKTWNGSSWQDTPLQIWNGSAWVPAALFMWDGASWQVVQ